MSKTIPNKSTILALNYHCEKLVKRNPEVFKAEVKEGVTKEFSVIINMIAETVVAHFDDPIDTKNFIEEF